MQYVCVNIQTFTMIHCMLMNEGFEYEAQLSSANLTRKGSVGDRK
jgi:hypothetical protein